MDIVVWTANKDSDNFRVLSTFIGLPLVIKALACLIRTCPDLKYRFTTSEGNKKYTLAAFLDKQGYQVATKVIAGTKSYYNKEKKKRLNIPEKVMESCI